MSTSQQSGSLPETGQAESTAESSHDESAKPDERRTPRRRTLAVDVNVLRRRVYVQSDLSSYSVLDRLKIYLADIFFYALIRTICTTLRWEIVGSEHLARLEEQREPMIFTSWHSAIFGATWFWRRRGIVVMSSHSRDGEYIGRFIKRFGYGTARGSATRGSGRALVEMAECLDAGIHTGFTIDGPRGPAYVAKPGAVTLARHSGRAILPFHVAARRCFELPSWDRLQIPWPFTRAVTLIGEPVYVPRTANPGETAEYQDRLQSALDDLRSAGEQWRRG